MRRGHKNILTWAKENAKNVLLSTFVMYLEVISITNTNQNKGNKMQALLTEP